MPGDSPLALDLVGLARDLYSRVEEGVVVPFKDCSAPDYAPRQHECHHNVDLWALANPKHGAVRGWLWFDFEILGFHRFTPHSVVTDESGQLFDPTPSRASQRYPLIRHKGSDDEFKKIVGGYGLVNLDYWVHQDRATVETA